MAGLGRRETLDEVRVPAYAEDIVPHEDDLRDVPLRGGYSAERYLYVHELGHVFGLVGTPIEPIQSRVSDTDCRCHSVDPDSVMAFDGRGWRASVSPDDPAEVFETVVHDDFQRWSFSAHDIEDVRAFQTGT